MLDRLLNNHMLKSLLRKMQKLFKKYIINNIDLFFYVFLFSYFFYKFTSYKSFFYLYINEWAFSETLINYSGGFVRRGFLGEFFSTILQTSGSRYYTLSFVFFLSSFIHCLYFIYNKSKHFPLLTRLAFIFCPFGIYYLISNINFFFGRRDILILNFLIVMCSKNFKSFNSKIFTFFIFGAILTLTYEMFLFFLPLFWKIIISHSKQESNLKIITFGLISTLNILMITLYSTPRNFNFLCKNIEIKRINMNLENLNCWGAPYYLENQNKLIWISEIIEGLKFSSNYALWSLSLFLLLMFINFFGSSYKLLIIPLFALFFIAQDYGRWFFLIFATTVIVSTENEGYHLKLNRSKTIGYLLIMFGIVLDIPVYLFQVKEFLRF